MKLYKISCFSDCGTYFQPYLQSVTVLAETKEQAVEQYKEWSNSNDKFVYEEKKWDVEDLGEVDSPKVIDYLMDTDY